MENKKAVIYCRVSTKEQVEEGNSLSTQEKLCKEYALKNGYEIAKVFIEQGESAKTVNRTELQRLLSFCANRKNQISAIIAYKLDRISRNTDDYSQIRILLKRYGVAIKSTTEYFENTTPAGRFMENIIANVSQFDNDVRTERSVGGMREAMREGRYVWSAPFGYSNTKVAGKSTIGPNKGALVLREVFKEVAKGIMPVEHIRLKYITLGLVNKNGKAISKAHLYRLLRNELFTGWISKFGERHKGAFEPIVSEMIFEQVQWVLQGRKKRMTGYLVNNPDFPLRRFMYHPDGSKLTGSWSQGKLQKYAYYRYKTLGSNFSKSRLEQKAADFFSSFELDENCYSILKSKVREQLTKQTDLANTESERLKKMIVEIEKMQSDLYQKSYKGIITDAMLRKQLERLEIQEMELKRSLIKIPETKVSYDTMVRNVGEFLKAPGDTWVKATFNSKIRLQEFVFPQGLVFDKEKIRTPEICNLFKGKSLFLGSKSLRADSRFQKSNTTKTIKSALLPNKEDEVLFWRKIGEELIELNEILIE